MSAQFQGKVALVTGSSSGIGRVTALAFAREGAKVIVTADKNIQGGQETVQNIKQAGGEATFIKVEVSKAAEVESMVNKIIKVYGSLDYAFNNAGVTGSHMLLADCTEEEWDRTINVNLKGIWLCMKYEILWMINHGGGVIVNMSSILGLKGVPTNADYTASKSGIVGLTKSAAVAYAKNNIRVNAVCPGITLTPMTEKEMGSLSMANKIPLGRVGRPEEIAETVIWLSSNAASYITGLAIPVDGGVSV